MGSSPPSVNDLIHPYWARVIINIDPLPVCALTGWWDKSLSLCFIQWSFQRRTPHRVWGQPINAPSISYTLPNSVFECQDLRSLWWLDFDFDHSPPWTPVTSELGQMGLARFFFHSPSERTGWQIKMLFFSGFGRSDAWRHGEMGGTFLRDHKRWTCWCLMTAPREVTPPLRSLAPSFFLLETNAKIIWSILKKNKNLENYIFSFNDLTAFIYCFTCSVDH